MEKDKVVIKYHSNVLLSNEFDNLNFEKSFNSCENVNNQYFTTYENYYIHETMIRDKVRTESYLKFIEKNSELFNDKIVMDLGAGTGILSLFIAKLTKAKEILAVEKSNIASKYTSRICQKYPQIKVIKSEVEKLDPEKYQVDIIISEWMGYFLLFESMLDSVLFARDNLLKPGGLIFPDFYTINISLNNFNYDLNLNRLGYWDNVYDHDMSYFKEMFLNEPEITTISPNSIQSDVYRIFQIDINTIIKEDLDFSSKIIFSKEDPKGSFNSFAAWFDVFFNNCENKIKFSTSPFNTPTHWKQTCFYLDEKLISNNNLIEGHISVKKCKNNPRELDIKFKLIFSQSEYKDYFFHLN